MRAILSCGIILVFSLIKGFFEFLPLAKGTYIYWIPVAIIIQLWFIIQKSDKLKFTLFDIFICILFCILLYNFFCLSSATLYNINLWYLLGYFIIFGLCRQLLSKNTDVHNDFIKILWILSFLAIVNAIIVLLQNSNILLSPNIYQKITGCFFSPNQLAAYLAVGILSVTALLIKISNPKLRLFLLTALLIISYALYLTKSRGAWLGLAITCIGSIYFFRKKTILKQSKILLIIFVLCGVFFVVKNSGNEKLESASGRLFISKITLLKIMDHPFFGYGFDSFSLEYNKAKTEYFNKERSWKEIKNAGYIYNANNDYLELTLEFGLTGLAVFVLFMIVLLLKPTSTFESAVCKALVFFLGVFALSNSLLPVPALILIFCISTVFLICMEENRIYFQIQFSSTLKAFYAASLLLLFGVWAFRMDAEYNLYRVLKGKTELINQKDIYTYTVKIDARGEELFLGGGILLNMGHYEEGLNFLELGFKRSGRPALARILAKMYINQDNFKKAEELYIYNIKSEPFRYQGKMDLFILYLKYNKKSKALKIAQEIRDMPVKVPSPEIDEYKKVAGQFIINFYK